MYWRICILLIFSYPAITQTTLTITGTVREAFRLSAVDQAQLSFAGDKLYTAISDSNGFFRIENIEPGRYDITISAKQYQQEYIKGFLIGRTHGPLLFELYLKTTNLPELVVTERKTGSYIHPLSNIAAVTREETERLPAGFFDPARLFVNQAGVTGLNDGANHLVIRGNNPAFVKWMINGTEIINPNHLSNAGTFTDQASTSGGGVNMISASVLENTHLHKGPYSALLGNALAGAIDLNLRKGNTESLKTEAQISLLGLELGLEGPLSKKGGTLVTRYRYSTVGLLADLGAKFGDEDISYQDFMFHVAFPSAKKNVSLFLFTGNHVNDYVGKDSSLLTIDKERYNIRYDGGQLIGGLLTEFRSNNKNRIFADIIYSKLKNHRAQNLVANPDPGFGVDQLQSKLSFHPRWQLLFDNNSVLTTGLQLHANNDQIVYSVLSPNLETRGDEQYITAQPYTNLLIESGKWSWQAGLHSMIINTLSVEPRLQARYRTSSNTSIQMNVGKYTQLPNPVSYFKGTDFELMKSWQAQLSHEIIFKKFSWTNAVFLQRHWDIPTNRFNKSYINESPGTIAFSTHDSKAKIYGIESSLHGSAGKWALSHNLSVFKSLFTAFDFTERASRFDQQLISHHSIGREWSRTKDRAKRLIGFYTAIHLAGSLKDHTHDTQFENNPVYNINRPMLFRWDARVYRRKFYKQLNTLIALDIQNIMNRQNFSYSYWDSVKQAVHIQNQLGILPNLSYTIEF